MQGLVRLEEPCAVLWEQGMAAVPWQLFWGENKNNPLRQCNRTPYIYITWGILRVQRVLE